MGKSSGQVAGYQYYMTILMGIARGALDQLVQIKVGDMVAFTQTVQGTCGNLSINQPQLFGGDESEGGLVGGITFFTGLPDQTVGSGLKQIIGSSGLVPIANGDGSTLIAFPPVNEDADPNSTDYAPTTGAPVSATYELQPVMVPELRGVTTVLYDGQICSNNPYPKAWKFRCRRVLSGWDGDPWYPERAVIMMNDEQALAVAATDAANISHTGAGSDGDGSNDTTNTTPASSALQLPENGDIMAMNPAHILYECITNRTWGRGLDRLMIDDPSFTSAANWLYGERFGLCLRWSKTDDLSSFIQSVLDHMGAALYTDRQTGLLTLRLIRFDYNIADLAVFDYESGVISIEDSSNASADVLTNEVVVKYHSPVSDSDRQVRANSLASIQALGSVVSTSKEYPGIPTPDLAMQVAQRDLAAVAWGIKSYDITVDRRGYKIMPGGVFVLNAPDRNILSSILRCVTIADSTQTDGAIKITAVQDVFTLPLTTFGQTQATQWKKPNKNPLPVTYHRLVEATYRDAYLRLNNADLLALGPTNAFIQDLAVAPTTLAARFILNTKTDGENFQTYNSSTFTTFGRLQDAITRFQTNVVITGLPRNAVIKLPFVMLIDDEFIKVNSLNLDTGIGSIERGVVDTVPVGHASGAVVWLYDSGSSDQREYYSGETVYVAEQTVTSVGTLMLSSCPVQSIVMVGRQGRPWCPCNVTVNGPYEAAGNTIVATDLTVNWSNRNRLLTQDTLLGYTTPTQSPEANQTTSFRVRDATTGKVLNVIDSLVGTQFIYTQAMAIRDKVYGPITIELYAVRDGITSLFATNYTVIYYPAAPVVIVQGQPAPRVGIGGGLFSLTNGGAFSRTVIGGTMVGVLDFFDAMQIGSSVVTVTAPPKTLALKSVQYGSTMGGWSLTAFLGLSSDLSGTVPALGQMTGNMALTSKLGDNTVRGTGQGKLVIGQYVATGKFLPGYGQTYGTKYGS